MTDERDKQSDIRHDRLASIVSEHACSIHDRRTGLAFLAPAGQTPRFAAAVSKDPAILDRVAAGGRLIVADSISTLAELLDLECRRGLRAYGRVWDLDLSCEPPRNLDVWYWLRAIETERDSAIYRVRVVGREDGNYFFDHPHDAEDFLDTVRRHGDRAELSEELLYDRFGADALIGDEARVVVALFDADAPIARATVA